MTARRLNALNGITSRLAAPLLLAAASTGVPAAQTPVALTPDSFTQDMVVEAGAANDTATHYSAAVSATMDGGAAKAGATFFEKGLLAGSAAGLPAGGFFTSRQDPSITFQLQPYTQNNAVLLNAANPSATLTLAQPGTYRTLFFLTASSDGVMTSASGGPFTTTLNYADGSHLQLAPFRSSDWFGSPRFAVGTGGDVAPLTGVVQTFADNFPGLYENGVAVPPVMPISSVTVQFEPQPANTNAAVFAVSGDLVSQTPEPSSSTFFAASVGVLLRRRRRQ